MSIQVSLFVGGVQKSGTQSVTNYLRQHPNIAVHKKKEGHFFDRSENFDSLKPKSASVETYHNSFDACSKTQVMCDITPDYIFRKGAIERVYHYNPNANWVIMLRNPIQRAFSAWNMEVNRKAETLSFEQALLSELNGNPDSRSHDRFQYIGRSRYIRQIEQLWNFFPRSKCHIFCAEMVWENPQPYLAMILESLGVVHNQKYDFEHKHKGVYSSELTERASEILMEQLQIELTQLPAALGWKNNPWK